MLVLEPLCLCWSGQLCSSLGESTGKDLPGFSQISAGEPWAWTEGTPSKAESGCGTCAASPEQGGRVGTSGLLGGKWLA